LRGHVTPLKLGALTNVADTDDVRAQEESSGQVIQLVMGVDVRLVPGGTCPVLATCWRQ
jgi:hypothetical protein